MVAKPSCQMISEQPEVLAGVVERVTFHNGDTGFCVLRVKARGHRYLATVVGHAATISAGECRRCAQEDGTPPYRWTRTGILECVRTLTVSLPRTIAAMPRRPCEAITMRSQPFDSAVSIIAW